MPKVWYGLAQELVRRGHRVSIMARAFTGQASEERSGDLTVIRTRGFAQGKSVTRDVAKDFIYALNVLPRLPEGDILVTNDFCLPALAGAFGRRAGAIVVCAARYPKGQYRLYRRAARIVAISTAVRDAIVAEQPALRERTVVIPLPVELPSRAANDRPATARKRTLLYVGRVHPEKGIELLLHAFAHSRDRFPDWRMRIVGPVAESDGGGGAGFERALHESARGLDVAFRGGVFDAAELTAEYQNADLFCYPSLSERGEAFGLAVLEAMAAGLPPIVSRLGCFRDFVQPGENGWTFDHRASNPRAALNEVLVRAMSADRERQAMGERARALASRLTYAVVADRYLDEFERILSTQRESLGA